MCLRHMSEDPTHTIFSFAKRMKIDEVKEPTTVTVGSRSVNCQHPKYSTVSSAIIAKSICGRGG